jgi:hypothetical protein
MGHRILARVIRSRSCPNIDGKYGTSPAHSLLVPTLNYQIRLGYQINVVSLISNKSVALGTFWSQIEGYTRLLMFRKFDILPTVFHDINEKIC